MSDEQVAVGRDERRKIARKLRAAAAYLPNDIESDDLEMAIATTVCNYDVPNVETLLNRLADLIEPQSITGDTSDGYHTFNELYDHRANLFSVIVRCFKDRAWKSKLHHDGTMYEGMFIVGIDTPQGQATYHYDIDPYWSVFDCKELARAPEWDGHTPEQAISRIASLRPSCDRDAMMALADECMDASRAYAGDGHGLTSKQFANVARRVREALGVEIDH